MSKDEEVGLFNLRPPDSTKLSTSPPPQGKRLKRTMGSSTARSSLSVTVFASIKDLGHLFEVDIRSKITLSLLSHDIVI
jgi:hypothetical protein